MLTLLRFVPIARIAPELCTAFGDGLNFGYIGQPTQFTIQSRDQFDEDIKEGGEQFRVELSVADQPIDGTIAGACLLLLLRWL